MKESFRKNTAAFYLSLFLLFPFAVLSEIHGSITATTNYVWRGYSKSHDDFSALANLDYEHDSGFFLGTTASRVDFGDKGFDDRAQFEIIPYLGWSFPIAEEWRMDLQLSRYFYNGAIFGEHSDYNELYGFLHYSDLVTAKVSFSEDYYHRGHAAADFEASGRYPLTDWLEISAAIGYSLTKDAIEYDYLYWNSGISVYYKFLGFDLRYFDAMETAETHDAGVHDVIKNYPETLDSTVVFSISVGF